MINRLAAIERNNRAVRELQKGFLHEALESICVACYLTSQHDHAPSPGIDSTQYSFHWHDCSQQPIKGPQNLINPKEMCIYMNLLTITAPPETATEDGCSCGFTWVIWYNMALLYAVSASVVGTNGSRLLHFAGMYLERVKKHLGGLLEKDGEELLNRDLSRLQLAILNNQAYISNELCRHAQAKEQLNEMKTKLSKVGTILDGRTLEEFILNHQCLDGRGYLAASA